MRKIKDHLNIFNISFLFRSFFKMYIWGYALIAYVVLSFIINTTVMISLYRRLQRCEQGLITAVFQVLFIYSIIAYAVAASVYEIWIFAVLGLFSLLLALISMYNVFWCTKKVESTFHFQTVFEQYRLYKPILSFSISVRKDSNRDGKLESHTLPSVPLPYNGFTDFSEYPEVLPSVKPYHFYFPYEITLSEDLQKARDKKMKKIKKQYPSSSVSFRATMESGHQVYATLIPEDMHLNWYLRLNLSWFGIVVLLIFSILGLFPVHYSVLFFQYEEVRVPIKKTVY